MKSRKILWCGGVLLLTGIPAAALAQANHNTARSNKSTVAAPADNAASDQGAAHANHNTARSNKNTVAPGGNPAGPEATATQEPAAAPAATINTSRSNTKGS